MSMLKEGLHRVREFRQWIRNLFRSDVCVRTDADAEEPKLFEVLPDLLGVEHTKVALLLFLHDPMSDFLNVLLVQPKGAMFFMQMTIDLLRIGSLQTWKF